jgi:hypothetical protein
VSLAGPIIALTSGGTAPIPAPKVSTPPCTALLQNVSPFALQAQVQGGTIWVAPYVQQSVPWSNAVGITVTAEPIITSPVGAPATLLVTFYDQGEAVPANGPITGYTSISGATINASIAGPLTVSFAPGTTVSIGGSVATTIDTSGGPVLMTGTVAISSGTVNVGTIAGAVSIAANQVVAVQNTSGGTVQVGGTVAISSGTVNVGTISGSVTIASGSVSVSGTVAISSGTINIGTISGAVSLTSGTTIITETGSLTDITPSGSYSVSYGTSGVPGNWYQVLAANGNRRGLLIFANWSNAVQVGVGLGTTGYFSIVLNPGDYWEMPAPIWTGIIFLYYGGTLSGGFVNSYYILTEIT